MDFAPYQDQNPETSRALSPPPGTRSTPPPSTRSPPPAPSGAHSDPWGRQAAPQSGNAPSSGGYPPGSGGNGGGPNFTSTRSAVSEWETTLPLRLDIEAAFAYLLLPPAGGVMLLLGEWRSDYVRFHAWQSSLLFASIFVLHLVFSWSTVISWIMFVGDIALIAFLAQRAYRDADTLDRFEVPFFGRLANSILDDE